jgi:hypothetical protein
MPIRLSLPVLSFLLLAWPVAAQDLDATMNLAHGRWALAYHRVGEFKPLGLKHKEDGTSYVCIDGDARAMIVDWVTGKGCVIERESTTDGIYRMQGQCRLKWWNSMAIPVSVELRPETATHFRLNIRTLNGSLLGFSERTDATHQGPCEPPASPKSKPAPAASG